MLISRILSRGVLAASMAAVLGATAIGAQAQPRDHRNEGRHEGRHDNRQGGRPDARHDDRRHARPQDHRGPHAHPPGHRPGPPMARPPGHRPPPPHFHGGRGAGPSHDWRRGGYVPPMYRSRHYVVNDWRHHHLAPPPRGYHWVQYGADYVLIAVTTGLIAQIILSN